MSKKLAVAQFGAMEENQVKEIVRRFANAFPSLDGIETVVPELLAFCETGTLDQKVADVLAEASVDGEWPAAVKLTGDNHGKGWETFELVITPYCGDRHLRIRHSGSWRGCGWEWFVECDYRDRPSSNAASKVIELFEDNLYYNLGLSRWNDPEWDDNPEWLLEDE